MGWSATTWRRHRRTIRIGRRLADDTHILLAIAIAAAAVVIELIAGADQVSLVAAIGLAFVALQALLALVPGPLTRPLPRLVVSVAVISGLSLVVGETGARPMGALYLPVIAVAAAVGWRETIFIGGLCALAGIAPVLVPGPATTAVAQRGAALVVTAVALAVGTRRTVGALESAVDRARVSRSRERRRVQQMAGVEAVGRLLVAGISREGLQQLMTLLRERFGYRFASIYLIGDDGRVRLGAQHGYETAIETFDESVGVIGRVMRTRETAFVRDVLDDPDYRAADGGVRCEVCVPLLAGGELLGVLNVEDSRVDGLDVHDRSTLTLVAERLAGAIALGRDREAIARRAELFQALAGFSRTVNASIDQRDLYAVIVAAVASIMDSDVVTLTVRDQRVGDDRIAALHGGDQRFVGVRIPEGEGVTGRAIQTRALVVDSQLVRDRFPSTVRGADTSDTLTSAAVPLVSDELVLGAIGVGRRDLTKPYTGLEQEVLPIVAGHVALAIANAELHARVADAAIRDPLTGLFNRRHLDAALDRMLAARDRLAVVDRRPIAAILFDLDHFGTFNKRHGHGVGDDVLRTFASILQARFRASDIVARFGGEEFLVILDGASLEEATRIAEDVRVTFQGTPIDMDGRPVHATVSAGCSAVGPEVASMESLLQVADVALQMAKRAGRNQIVAA